MCALKQNDDHILYGRELLYEPSSGGLGYEIFNALNRYKGKIVQHIVSTGEVDYYEDLLQRSIRTAIYLRKQNLQREDIVCLCCGNHINSLVPLIAAKFIDVNYTSVDTELSEKEMVYVFNYVKPKVIFIAEEDELRIRKYSKQFKFLCELIVFGASIELTNFPKLMQFSEEEIDFRPVHVEDITETAIIFNSSGTTGDAKGICLSHYSILGNTFNVFNNSYHKGTMRFSNFSHKFDEKDDLKFMFFSPMYWITGTYFSLGMIFTGGARVVGSSFNAEKVWNALDKYSPDTLFLPSGQMNALCRYASNKEPNTSLDVFLTSGIRLSETHIQSFKKCFPSCKLLQCYGQTENSGLIASFNVGSPEEMQMQEKYPTSCGKPLPGYHIKIVSIDEGNICGPMEQGEVRVKNKFIMNGYYNKDSSAVFDSDGYFKTGDLGYFDENRILYILERVVDLVHYKDHFFSPSIIENILIKHPAVLEGFVFGYPNPTDKEHAMGVVVLKEDFKNKVSQDEIVTFVNEKVPDDMYKIRAGIKFVEALLKTPSSKLRRIPMKRLIIEGKF